MRAFLAVIACLSMAGCTGARDDSDPGTAPIGDPAVSLADDNPPELPSGSPSLVWESIAWQGDVGTHDCVWVPGVPGSCLVGSMGPPQDPMSEDAVVFIADTNGAAKLAGNLTLTWQEASPLTHGLVVLINSYQCDDACTDSSELSRISGMSPLTIPLDGLSLEEGQRVGFFFRPSPVQVAGVQVVVGLGQPIMLEGDIGYQA